MITTNFNVVQVSSEEKEKYTVGDAFSVPEHFRNNIRFMKFDGLKIKDVTFGFGIFLHFDFDEWKSNNSTYQKEQIIFFLKKKHFLNLHSKESRYEIRAET